MRYVRLGVDVDFFASWWGSRAYSVRIMPVRIMPVRIVRGKFGSLLPKKGGGKKSIILTVRKARFKGIGKNVYDVNPDYRLQLI